LSVIHDRELAAVIAHGLLNTVAAVSGSARTLRRYGHRLGDDDYEVLLGSIVDNAGVFMDGLDAILENCSDAFGDAATTMALAARTIRSVPEADLPQVLDGLVAHTSVLELGLAAMVRGLSPELLEFLNGLQRRPPSTPG
jgi:hypothetical protein